MNQSFNITRFQRMLKFYIAEYRRSYLITLALMVGGMLLLMSPILATERYNDLLYGLHISSIFVVILGSSLFTGTAFSAYNNPSQGIPALMLPASRLEKFLVIWLANLLFVVLVAGIFYYLHHGLIYLANQDMTPTVQHYWPLPSEVFGFIGFSYFLLQGACFLGSLYFTKNAFIKTLGVLMLALVLAFGFNLFLAYQFTGTPDHINTFPFTFWDVLEGRHYRVVFPSSVSTLTKVFLAGVVIALWAITYVRLKEKEI
ncbi:MAG: hypothetical protein RIG62_14080 [Cyclobacteriaceae bacterium]